MPWRQFDTERNGFFQGRGQSVPRVVTDVEEKMAEADLNARLAASHDCGRECSASRANVGTQRQGQPEPKKMYA